MKILMTAPFEDASGYGKASLHYIRSLDTTDIQILGRSITYNEMKSQLLQRDTFLLDKSRKATNVDVILQCTTPNDMRSLGRGTKSIGLMFWQTNKLPKPWVEKINQMDGLIVANHDNKNDFIRCGVTVPIEVVHVPCNIQLYTREIQPLKIDRTIQDTFKFYSIFQLSTKKGFDRLIRAFYAGFEGRSDVSLIVKTFIGQQNRDIGKEYSVAMRYIKQEIDKLILQSVPRILLDLSDWTDTKINRLHKTGDCFVLPSFGEAWNIPSYDAQAFGNTPIVGNWGGPTEYIKNQKQLINTTVQPVYGMSADIYSSDQRWHVPNIDEFIESMRMAADGKLMNEDKKMNVQEFSYDNMGPKLLAAINKICEVSNGKE